MWTGACWRSYFFRCLNKSFRCQLTSWINFGISQGLNTRLNMCVCVGIAISVVSCCLLLPLFFCGLPLLFYQYVECCVTMCDICLFHLSRNVFIVSISSKLQKVLKEENAFLVPFWSYYVHAVTITNLFTKRCVFAPAIDSAIGSGAERGPRWTPGRTCRCMIAATWVSPKQSIRPHLPNLANPGKVLMHLCQVATHAASSACHLYFDPLSYVSVERQPPFGRSHLGGSRLIKSDITAPSLCFSAPRKSTRSMPAMSPDGISNSMKRELRV